MSTYRLEEAPELDAPVIVAALEGWVDAGSAGTTAAAQLAEGATLVATFDADAIYYYRARRPTLDIVDGRPMYLAWPKLELTATRIGARDLLVLRGPEPDYRWRELTADVIEVAKQLGVASGRASARFGGCRTRAGADPRHRIGPGLLPDGIRQGPDGLLRVPSACLSVLELSAAANGIPAIGLFAQVPHYVNATYPAASIALLTALGRHLGIEPPVGQLATRALERRNLLDAATATDEDTKAHVERLEGLVDEARLPEGDELIADIERFLREGTGEGDDGDEGGGSRLH